MARALTFLFVVCLLKGALSGQFMATLPKTIEVLEGSCVTIPCSFDIESRFENCLNDTCRALWKNKDENFYTSHDPKLTTTKEMTGDLRRKDCTTTFNNMSLNYSNEYYFRLDCEKLKGTFTNTSVHILVKADPPSPTLTPSTLEEQEGTSVRLTCSAPAPCWSHLPTLTWTPRLGDTQETLQENQDKTKVMTSVLTFTASHLHHGRTISCTATYSKQDGSSSSSVSRDLTAAISCGPNSGFLPWAVAGVSLSVNVFCIIFMAFLWKARRKVKPKEEERTYMSLERRDKSSEYDIIAQPQN